MPAALARAASRLGRAYRTAPPRLSVEERVVVLRLPGSPPRSSREPVPSSAPPAAEPAAAGKRSLNKWFGNRYRLIELIGEGATGRVYRARDLLLETDVALKVLNPRMARDPSAVAALKREARLARSLSHSHIVRLYDLQQMGDAYFLMMEYIEGQPLDRLLAAHGRFAPALVVRMIAVCADALTYAHRHGVLHNDLKPGNLIMSGEGVLKIIDFGIAGFRNTRPDGEWIQGTPAYMSPEQIRGDRLDERTDEYALAVVACELLTGIAPFPNDLAQTAERKASPVRPAGLADEVWAVLARAVSPDKEARFESVQALAEALEGAVPPSAESDPA